MTTTRVDYTVEEWETLEALPFLVGAAVVSVSGSWGTGKMKEIVSLGFGPLDLADQFLDNTLIRALVDAHEKGEEKVQVEEGESEGVDADSMEIERDDVDDYVLEKCREGLTLLAQKSTPKEAEEYKRWLILSAERVAHAAKTGGFMGIGGKTVDEHEERFLRALSETLGVSRS